MNNEMTNSVPAAVLSALAGRKRDRDDLEVHEDNGFVDAESDDPIHEYEGDSCFDGDRLRVLFGKPDEPIGPDHNMAIEFLIDFHRGRRWLLTSINPDGAGPSKIVTCGFDPTDPSEAFSARLWIIGQNDAKRNIYFHVNEVRAGFNARAKRTDIVRMQYLQVDIDPEDGQPLEQERDRIIGLLTTALPVNYQDRPPTFVISSGSGGQAFWALREPVEVNGDEAAADRAAAYNKTLEHAFGADGTSDVSRIMRLPGTVNWPDAGKRAKGRVPTLATLVEGDPKRIYDVNHFTPTVGTPAVVSVPTVNITVANRIAAVDDLDTYGVSPSTKAAITTCYPKGLRSGPLFKACCGLVEAGVDDDTIYGIITDPKFSVSDSVLDKGAQVQRYAVRQIQKARQACANAAQAPTTTSGPINLQRSAQNKNLLMFNDTGFMTRFVLKYGPEVRYIRERRSWAAFEGGRWMLKDTQQLYGRAASTAQDAVDDCTTQQLPGPALKIANGWFDQPKQKNMLELAMGHDAVSVSATAFDTNPDLLNVRNGTIDLSTGQLRQHRAEDLITKITDIEYKGQDEPCPFWEQTLELALGGYDDGTRNEIKRFLAQLVGYTLTGRADLKKLLFLWGEPDSGKSTIIWVIETLAGEYFVKTGISTFTRNRQDKDKEIASLVGARMVSASETEEGTVWDESLLKDITGGDKLKGRQIYERQIQFSPQFTLWLYGNSKPQARTGDAAFWNRFWLLGFDKPIPPDQRRGSTEVKRRLATEMPGILAWAVRGWLDYVANGIVVPPAITQAGEAYAHEATPLVKFFEECCVRQHQLRSPSNPTGLLFDTEDRHVVNSNEKQISEFELIVSHTELFKLYEHWVAENNDYRRMDKRQFTVAVHGRSIKNSDYTPQRMTYFAGITPNGIARAKNEEKELYTPRPQIYNPDAIGRKKTCLLYAIADHGPEPMMAPAGALNVNLASRSGRLGQSNAGTTKCVATGWCISASRKTAPIPHRQSGGISVT